MVRGPWAEIILTLKLFFDLSCLVIISLILVLITIRVHVKQELITVCELPGVSDSFCGLLNILTLWYFQVDSLLWEFSGRWSSCALIKHEDVVLTQYRPLWTFPLVEGVKQEVVFLQENVAVIHLVVRRVRRLLWSEDVILKEEFDCAKLALSFSGQAKRNNSKNCVSNFFSDGLTMLSKVSAGWLVGFTAGNKFSSAEKSRDRLAFFQNIFSLLVSVTRCDTCWWVLFCNSFACKIKGLVCRI